MRTGIPSASREHRAGDLCTRAGRAGHGRAGQDARGRPRTTGALVRAWFRAFAAEALPSRGTADGRRGRRPSRAHARRQARRRRSGQGSASGSTRARSCRSRHSAARRRTGCASGLSTPRRSVGGRGYASAITAALSTQLLASGRRFCFLYTDLANPTSNRIYRAIGYEHVCDAAEIVFEPDRRCVNRRRASDACPRSRGRASERPPSESARAAPTRLRRPGAGRGRWRQSGMLPCFRFGPGSRLVSAVSSAEMSTGRVRRGSITSSM